jgi:hypothetical protein
MVYAALGAAGLLFYSVLVPAKLHLTVEVSAVDGEWTEEELESHGWLLLKVSTQSFTRVNRPGWLASEADARVSVLMRCACSTSQAAGGSISRCSTTRSSSLCSVS